MSDHKKQHPEKEGLFIPARQVSGAIVAVLAVAAVLFMSGYVVGKKQVVEELMAQVEHDVFADQIYSSMCSLYDAGSSLERIACAIPKRQEGEHECSLEDVSSEESLVQDELSGGCPPADAPFYVGQLLSYHARHYADAFVQKVARKHIPLEVRTRKSVTAAGKTKKWYQVVTKPYSDRQELERIIEQVAYEENIKGVKIVVCS